MSVRIRGMAKLNRKLREIEAKVEASSPVAVRAGAEAIARQMRATAPVRTGALRAAISVDITSFGDGATARVGSNVPYDRFVQRGTVHMEPQAYGEEAARDGAAAVVAAMAAVYRTALPG